MIIQVSFCKMNFKLFCKNCSKKLLCCCFSISACYSEYWNIHLLSYVCGKSLQFKETVINKNGVPVFKQGIIYYSTLGSSGKRFGGIFVSIICISPECKEDLS